MPPRDVVDPLLPQNGTSSGLSHDAANIVPNTGHWACPRCLTSAATTQPLTSNFVSEPSFISTNSTSLHNLQPKFLGFTLKRLLNFGPHVQNISITAATRCFPHLKRTRVMKANKPLQLIFLTCATPEWQPWADPSRTEQLERWQNIALTVVT